MSFYAEYRLRAIPLKTLEWRSDQEEIDFHEELSDILLNRFNIICDSEGDAVYFEHQPKAIYLHENLTKLSEENPDYIYLVQVLPETFTDASIDFYHRGETDYVRVVISYEKPKNELFQKIINPLLIRYPEQFFV